MVLAFSSFWVTIQLTDLMQIANLQDIQKGVTFFCESVEIEIFEYAYISYFYLILA
jgi:hypothetical protein